MRFLIAEAVELLPVPNYKSLTPELRREVMKVLKEYVNGGASTHSQFVCHYLKTELGYLDMEAVSMTDIHKVIKRIEKCLVKDIDDENIRGFIYGGQGVAGRVVADHIYRNDVRVRFEDICVVYGEHFQHYVEEDNTPIHFVDAQRLIRREWVKKIISSNSLNK